MATTLQLRRGTTAEADAWVGLVGELFVDVDNKNIRLSDGTTAGGTALSTANDITTQINSAISGVLDGAPGTLDTLNELAAAINDDPDFFNTYQNKKETLQQYEQEWEDIAQEVDRLGT